MAYVIGSDKGKKIADDMKVGEKVTVSDGSTWEKKSDGSISVTTSSGQKFDNAYKSSSKSGNSQYTGSSNSVITNNSTQQSIKDKMNANSIAWWSADEAGRKQLEAENQTLGGLLQGTVAYDSASGTWSGTAGGGDIVSKEDILGWNSQYNQSNPQPTAPQSDPRIDKILNQVLNRDSFSYDALDDPLYQQYREQYLREGDRAMRNTLAEAAAGAGGMNTYAMTAAMQANNYYNSQLNDKIPELYQIAYEKYLKDIDLQIQDLGILQDMDNTQYNRYRDTMSDWRDDKQFAYGAYTDAVNQGNWQANYDYNSMWDNINFNNDNYWANKEWTASEEQREIENNRADKNSAKEEVWKYIDMGIMPDAELIKNAGMDSATVQRYVDAVKAEMATKGSSSKGGSSGGGGGGDDPIEGEITWKDGLDDLGLSTITGPNILVELENARAIYEEDGKLVWADGWDNQNYLPKLMGAKSGSIFPTLFN